MVHLATALSSLTAGETLASAYVLAPIGLLLIGIR